MSTAVKRACDACHRRKVKCDGINPCRNCSSAQLSCTYNAIPQKKGPKGSRAKVISELRENQRQSSLSAKIQNRMNGGSNTASSTFTPTQGLLTNDMVKTCIDFFFTHLYSTMPILNRQRVEQDAMSLDTTLDTYCLFSSLCAFMMLQPGMPMPTTDPYGPDSIPGASIITATLLLEETLRVRKGYDYMQSPTHYTIATSYFLFACHYGLDLQDKAWCNLREATTLVHLVRLNREEAYQAWDRVDATRRRRLYWLLYIAERSYALQHDRPLSLKAVIDLPTPTDDPSDPLSGQLVGFCRLASLFRPFDGSFVDNWNNVRSSCTPSHVASLQKQQNDTASALAHADPQLGDVVRNQQWLQGLAWQVKLAKGTNSTAGNDAPGYQYSMLDISREVVPMAASFSNQGSSELLHSGLIESLITITDDLSGVLATMPSSGNPFTASPRDHMHQLANILAMLRIGEHRFAPLLLVKVHEVLPRLANPMLQSPPETACDIDIFDGFGSAGMVPQQYLQLDDFKTEATNPIGGAHSMQDVHSPFVSSPPILSPGMEFPHGINTDFNPIANIVMHSQPSVNNGASTASPGPQISGNQHQISQTTQVHQQVHLPQQFTRDQQQPQPQQTQQAQQTPHLHQVSIHHLQHQHLHHQQHHQPASQSSQQSITNSQFPQQPQPPNRAMPLVHSLGGNLPISPRLSVDINQSSIMNGSGQAIDQAQSMSSMMGNQVFVDVLSGMGQNPHSTGLDVGPQSQSSSGFGLATPGQQIRTVGDFQALQRANSDIGPLNTIVINDVGGGLGFGSLR